MVVKRAIYDIFLFLGLFLLPWYMGLFFVFLGIFLFINFYEFIFWILLFFSIYGYESSKIISNELFLAIIIIIVFFVLNKLKDFIIFYHND